MINYQLLSQMPVLDLNSHVISHANSSLLKRSCNSALLQALQAAAVRQTADCAFGCAPAGRITLLPDSHWHDTQSDTLIAELRPLLRKGTCTRLIVDCSLFDQRNAAVLSNLLHFLFNLSYQLSDLGLKSDHPLSTTHIQQLVFCCQPEQLPTLQPRLTTAAATAMGMIAARRLADMPSDRCTPAFFADQIAEQIAHYPSLSCEILDEQQIAQQGLGLLQAVGKGANNPPRLVVISYQGKDNGPFSAYVGKGVTFDSGGLWLKSGDGMYTMKYDMCGAANVFGLILAVAELKLPIRLVGVLALAENMIGPAAMRPGDVAVGYNGLTVEINNTDAEGRLVLADAIAYASKLGGCEQPVEYVIDLATLTGAVVKALGYDLTGLMTENAPLRNALTQAGLHSGDQLWSLPLDARFSKQVASDIADLCNTPTNNAAISTSAAYFLSRFCPAEIPWAHLDISGTALWRENGRSVASGRPIPLLVQHLLDRLENEHEKDLASV